MKILILLSFVFLNACTPANNVYVRKNLEYLPRIDQVLIVVEYLDIKQGFGGYWKFDENINLFKQNELADMARQILINKGYKISDLSLKTSGLILNRDFLVKHFYNKTLQPQIISPPYIVRSIGLKEQDIQKIETLLNEVNRPVSPVMSNLKGYIVNNYEKSTSPINISDNTAIFILQSYRSKALLYPSFGFDVNIQEFSSPSIFLNSRNFNNSQFNSITDAFLIHKGTGDLIWSNRIGVLTKRNQENFFLELPANHQQNLQEQQQ